MSEDKEAIISNPPRALREWIGWENTTRKERNLLRVAMSSLEIISLQAAAMLAFPTYKEASLEKLFVPFDAVEMGVTDIRAAIHKVTDKQSESQILAEQMSEAAKERQVFEVSNYDQLVKALSHIDTMSDEEKGQEKFEIVINGVMVVDKQIETQIHGKQPTEIDKYFDSNVGLILPQGVTLSIHGEDPLKDKLVFSNQKIGIYGENLGEITFSNLSFERNGEKDQDLSENEPVRSLIFLTTENDSVVTSQAIFKNVTLTNNIHGGKIEDHGSMMTSGITTSGFSNVHIEDSSIVDFYWDGVAAFGGRSLSVTDSHIIRQDENYFYNEGAAIAMIPGHDNAEMIVNNTTVENYVKYFGCYGPYDNQATVRLTDITTNNSIETGYYLISHSTENFYLDNVQMKGKGTALISPGIFRIDTLDIRNSHLIINPDSYNNLADNPKATEEVLGSNNTTLTNTTVSFYETQPNQNVLDILKDKQIPFSVASSN